MILFLPVRRRSVNGIKMVDVVSKAFSKKEDIRRKYPSNLLLHLLTAW